MNLLGRHTGMVDVRGIALEAAIVVAAGVGFLLFGYDQGVMSGIITEPLFVRTFPDMDENYKDGAIQAFVVAVYELGAFLGSIFIVFFGDKLGRRKNIMIGGLIMIVGAILQTTASTLGHLIVGRIVAGMGNGINTSTIPVWQAEMAHPKRRGFFVLFEGALITCGIMISYWLNFGLWFYSKTSFQWRFPIALQIVFAVSMVFGAWLLPESPRWLLLHGFIDEAVEVVCRLRNGTRESRWVKAEVKTIHDSIKAQVGDGPFRLSELFRNGPTMNLWRASVSFLSQAFQQLGGINLVTYYATSVFENSIGTSPMISRALTAANGTEYFASAIAALWIVDRLGRRRLMIFGSMGMIVSLACITGLLSTGKSNLAVGAAVFLFVYNTFFAIGWLGVTWLYPAEVTPLRIRAPANAISASANWIFNYLIVQIAPICIKKITYYTYVIFMGTNLAFIPIIYFFFPETKGRGLEELDDIFAKAHKEGRNPVWVEKEYPVNDDDGDYDHGHLDPEGRGHSRGSGSAGADEIDLDAELTLTSGRGPRDSSSGSDSGSRSTRSTERGPRRGESGGKGQVGDDDDDYNAPPRPPSTPSGKNERSG